MKSLVLSVFLLFTIICLGQKDVVFHVHRQDTIADYTLYYALTPENDPYQQQNPYTYFLFLPGKNVTWFLNAMLPEQQDPMQGIGVLAGTFPYVIHQDTFIFSRRFTLQSTNQPYIDIFTGIMSKGAMDAALDEHIYGMPSMGTMPFKFRRYENGHFTQQNKGVKICNRTVDLILKDSLKELSNFVIYPLHRDNPVSDIADKEAFIKDFPMLFDTAFKRLLRDYYDPTDPEIIDHQGNYGLLRGQLWLTYDGAILSVNYKSKAEENLQHVLEAQVKKNIYPTLKEFTRNYKVYKTTKNLIRIDQSKDGSYRYAAWQIGHKISEKPDLILTGGTVDVQGSGGWWSITFKNGDWAYVVDDNPKVGMVLEVLFKGTEKASYPLKDSK